MGIFLSVLAVIGKVLLVILIILLAFLACLLFAPFVYRGRVDKQEKFSGTVKISWMFFLLQLRLTFVNKDTDYELYLLGIPVFKLLKRRKERKSRKKKKVSAKKKKTDAGKRTAVEKKTAAERTVPRERKPLETTEGADRDALGKSKGVSSQANSGIRSMPTKPSAEPGQLVRKEPPEEKKKNIFIKIKEKLRVIPNTLKKIMETGKHLSDKVSQLFSKAESILDLVTSKRFGQAFDLVRDQLLKLLKHIGPRKIRGRVAFGLGRPDQTGTVLAVLGMAYTWIPEKLSIEPDFEEEKLEGNLSFSGHMILAVVLLRALKVLLNKQVRSMIKQFRTKEA